MAKQQVMLPCSKSCQIGVEGQEVRRGKHVGSVHRATGSQSPFCL